MTRDKIKKNIIQDLLSVKREGMKELVDYLEREGYFEVPASSKYHSNFWGASEDGECGGLAYHSYLVMELLKEKNEKYELELSDESIYIMAYLHDLAKLGLYGTKVSEEEFDKYGYKLKKDPITNKWVSDKVILTNNENPILHFGHGELSCIRIMQFLKKITVEELLAIRWHSGAYEAKEHYRDFQQAVKKYKSIMALHICDLEASQLMEDIIEPEECSVEEYNSYMKRVLEAKENKKVVV